MKSRGLDSKESWIVALGLSIVLLLVAWPIRLGNQLYVSMLDHFETDRKSVSFSFSLIYLMRSVSGPFAGYFSNKFGLRTVCLVGCILCIVGNGGCYFAKDIIAVHILFGLIYGIGLGCATNVGPEIINQHFKNHRSKANGFVFGMSGLIAFISPPVLQMILDEYGVSGSFLIMSSILLNSILGIMLLYVPLNTNEKQMHNQKKDSARSEDGGSVSLKNLNTDVKVSFINERKDFSNEKLFHLDQSSCLSDKSSSSCLSDKEIFQRDIQGPAQNKSDITKSSTLCKSTEFTSCTFTINNRFKEDFKEHQHLEMKNNPILLNARYFYDHIPSFNKNSGEVQSKTKQTSICSSFSVLLSPAYLFVTFISSSHYYVMYLSWTITVDVARDKRVEKYQEVYFVMALALFDSIGRFTLGILTDSGILSRANYCAICFAGMGLLCLAISWAKGFILTIIAVSLLGLICGGNTTGLPGIVNQFIMKEKRVMAMSSRLLLYAPMSVTVSPLIGYFRGNLGSYNWLYYIQAILCFYCCVLLIILPNVKIGKKQKS